MAGSWAQFHRLYPSDLPDRCLLSFSGEVLHEDKRPRAEYENCLGLDNNTESDSDSIGHSLDTTLGNDAETRCGESLVVSDH